MKKKTKKLVLAKETVQTLDMPGLEQALGGSVSCPTIFGWAGCWSNPANEDS
jgi:hypothetical protein